MQLTAISRPTAIFLITAILLPLVLPAQYDKYRFSRLDISKGLSHNEVTCIFKDEKGFLWFGTMSGLNRYDGYSFKVFKHDLRDSSSINDDFVVQILQGPAHKLWITTREGFAIYDPLTEKFDRNLRGFLHSIHIDVDTIADIKKGPADDYWFLATGSGAGLYKYNASTGSVTAFHHRQGDDYSLHAGEPCSFAADPAGNWWIVYTDGMLEQMDEKNGRIIRRSEAVRHIFPAGRMDYRLYVDAQGDDWLYSTGKPCGLLYYHPPTGRCVDVRKESGPSGLNTDLVTGVVQDDKGLIWVATDHGGINLLDKKDFSVRFLLNREGDDKSLSQNSINTLYKDNTGIIWIGTFKRGISYYHEDILKFPLYRHQPSDPGSLPFDDVNRFVEDARGNCWIGSNGGGLICFNRTTGAYTQYRHDPANPRSLSNDVIVSLCIDHEQKLWIGTYFGGLDCLEGGNFIHYRHNEADSTSIGDDRVWEIMEDSHKRLWIGTLAAGLDLLDRKRNVFIHYKPLPQGMDGKVTGNPPFTWPPGVSPTVHSAYISELVEDRQGNLWIGTAFGIDVLEAASGHFRHYANDVGDPFSLSNNNVISILQDSRGLIWVGTREGLNLFDAEKHTFKVYRTADGLPDNTILTMLEDNDHNLWVSTPGGLCNISLKAGPRNGTYSLHYTNYDESNGLQGREFNENAALKTREGELIFGGANGFNIFDPRHFRHANNHPQLVLTDLQVFNKSIGIGEKLNGHVLLPQSITESRKLTLRYNENVFSIGFAVLDFLTAQKVSYAYMLEGFNTDWLVSDDKTRKAVYTNLDPGHYTFKVRTAGDDGAWSSQVLTFPITILPPFWKTPLAYISYVLLLAGTLFLARRLILQRAHARFALSQERKEAQRQHELDRMKIRFFTNVSHEFRTPLSLILTPLDKIIQQADNPAQKAQFNLIHRNARRLLNMVNQLLDFRKLEVQELRLNAGAGDIVRFVKELSFSFADIAEKKNIQFSFAADIGCLYSSYDHDKVERIVFNLLSNAFKFTPEHGFISVHLSVLPAEGPGMPRWLQLRVKDTGIGMEKDKQTRIFERFFQNDLPGSIVNQGSGIGLAITKEFVKLHNGSIGVESQPGKGSCFTVLLPVVETASIPILVSVPVSESATAPISISATGRPASKRPSVLLVEDNEDFRFYLKDNLREYFTIIEAVNGREGWQKTLASHPDLVVADISMPEMNGIDLCHKIKADSRTSFVPVILLTALIGEEQQLKGLETGANDYMTKPFNFEILLSKIRNLLAQQEIAQKTYRKQLATSPADTRIGSPEEKFMRQALELVEKNISNPDFSVAEMSRELYLSRVALYKKLLALTGKTPLEFIRTTRLQRAAQLLQKKQFTVAEIAYEVGFNNPKYFSRYFKSQFGMLPSAYQRSSTPAP